MARHLMKPAVAGAVLLVFLSLCGAANSAPRRTLVQVGEKAPNIALWDVRGGLFFLSEVTGRRPLRGRHVVVISFFASWCKPCKKELPILLKLARKHAHAKLKVVMVGFREGPAKLNPLLRRLKIPRNVPVLADIHGVTAERYGVTGLPRLVVIDRNRKVAGVVAKAVPDLPQRLDRILKPLLSATPRRAGPRKTPAPKRRTPRKPG